MSNILRKVLEINKQKGHTNVDIRAFVNLEIRRLQKLYSTESDTMSIADKYKSTSYKSLMSFGEHKNDTSFDKLLKKCLLDETNISKFLKGDTINIQDSTKDFFAIYCGYEGYNDFIFKNKNVEIIGEPIIVTDIYKSSLQIFGSTIINEEFIDEIKKKEFSMAEFYTAKQNEDCQWYGILQNFDVIRKDYGKIKDIVVKSFRDQNCRISTIIYGSGGCGKSTLLRRLAIELSQEETQKSLQVQIKIVWLNDNGFEDFYSKGLPIIEQNYSITFLVIVEDWYRITELDKDIAYKFLKKADSLMNMRIVIGDRIVEKKCKEIFYGDTILISPDENKSIIETIIENNKEWKWIANQLFADENNYQCSLFLLLFIMAYASQNKNTQLNFSKPKKAFVDIIENDLKIIANAENKKYKGLAKALYYWACIYEKHRIFISFDSFLAIADYYNENKLISKYFSRWNMEDPILDKLKIYVNKNYSIGKHSDKNFIQFNHDILADEGLSKIDWGFSDTVNVDLLEVITNFGDDTSASSFLKIMILNEEQIFNDREEKLLFIDRLIEKKNQNPIYANIITKLKLNDSEIKNYAHKLFAIENYDHVFWSYYLNSIENDIVINEGFKDLLINSKLKDYDHRFFMVLLIHFRDEKFVQEILKEILNDDWRKNHIAFISNCLNILKNKKLKQQISNKILNDENWGTINPNLICRCLNYADEILKQRFSNEVLHDENWKAIPEQIINNCLSYADEKIRQRFSNEVLNDKNLEKHFQAMISNCLHYADEEIKQRFSNGVLNDENWKAIPQAIISNCLHYADEKIRQRFSNEVLNDKNLEKHFLGIISNCLHYADEEIKQRFSNEVLNNKNLEKHFQGIISNCLHYADEKIKHRFSNEVLNDGNLKKHFQGVISNCLHYTDDEIKQNFSNEVLHDENWKAIPEQIINNCLHYADEKIKHRFSNEVLNDENWKAIPGSIISNCLHYADEEIKHRFSNKVLNDGNWIRISFEIICSCLRISRNKEFALLILKDWRKYDWRIIYNSLLCFEKEKHFPIIVNDVIKEIISNHHNFKIVLKGKHFHYANLLRINLKNHTLWEKEATYIIKNWERIKRNIVTNILYSHRDTPNITELVCKDILIKWKLEVNKPILLFFKKAHYGDHVKIALGHPSLRLQAKKTAIEIINSIQQENYKVPMYIKEIVNQIVENDIYPEWEF